MNLVDKRKNKKERYEIFKKLKLKDIDTFEKIFDYLTNEIKEAILLQLEIDDIENFAEKCYYYLEKVTEEDRIPRR